MHSTWAPSDICHLDSGRHVHRNIWTCRRDWQKQNPNDKSTTKRRLDYWIDLAKLLEKGDINALFLADTYGGYDTYENSLDECIRRAAQWPMTDPTIVSHSPDSYSMRRPELTFLTAHLCHGSCDQEPLIWNHSKHFIRTTFLTCKALLDFGPSHSRSHRLEYRDLLEESCIQGHRYRHTYRPRPALRASRWVPASAVQVSTALQSQQQASTDERRLWEGSWSDDAIIADAENDAYFDPDKIRTIKHQGKYFSLESRHITDPSPQRTPFLFQAGTSP